CSQRFEPAGGDQDQSRYQQGEADDRERDDPAQDQPVEPAPNRLLVDPLEIEVQPEALPFPAAHAGGDLVDDLVRETSPDLLTGLVNPGVEPDGRSPPGLVSGGVR